MLLGLSCDDVLSHVEWPVIADPSRELIEQFNMVDPDEKDSPGQSVPSRALCVAGADRGASSKTRSNFSIFLLTDLLSFLYPASTGRNMDEAVRLLDSLERASKNEIANCDQQKC
uniref:Uncharacterized protein n=1 Tax=Populus trichocarpa TaxID=3694 RepID=A0A2K1YUF8_POPTR